MKTCPKCNSKYTDDSLQFCLQDGALLAGDGAGVSDLETVAFEEPETVISKKRVREIDIPPAVEELPVSQDNSFESNDHGESSNTLRTILFTVFGTLFVFAIGAGGLWFYWNWSGNRDSRSGLNGSNISANKNSTAKAEPTASATPTATKTKTPKPKPTPLPDDVKEKIEKESLATIFAWRTAAEARNLPAYMKHYSNNVAYYNKRGASRAFVQNDKKKAFEKYTSIKSQFSNIVVTPSKNGERATVKFDKEWNFSGEGELNTGKVRSQLILKKSGDRWLIEAEKDLKVYYVNK